jgi:NAD(P) transhydrogenase subunit alpha
MNTGSVIVDLAASTGGNCVLTRKDEIYTTDNGITIIGKIDQMPSQASYLYGNNLCNLLDDMGKAQNFKIDMNDDVIKRAMVTYNGTINWPPEPLAVSAKKTSAVTIASPEEEAKKKAQKTKKIIVSNIIWLTIIGVVLFALGKVAPSDFMGHITAFVLAVFVGWNVIWNVTHSLHTPLMSVTNAISGIIITGGLLLINDDFTNPITILSFIAILVASINIVGGFVVTYRMLNMFKK